MSRNLLTHRPEYSRYSSPSPYLYSSFLNLVGGFHVDPMFPDQLDTGAMAPMIVSKYALDLGQQTYFVPSVTAALRDNLRYTSTLKVKLDNQKMADMNENACAAFHCPEASPRHSRSEKQALLVQLVCATVAGHPVSHDHVERRV